MISNPSKKDTMAMASSKNSKKDMDTFAYDYDNNNERLIGFEDDDSDCNNDATPLGNDLNNSHVNIEEDGLRSHAIGCIVKF